MLTSSVFRTSITSISLVTSTNSKSKSSKSNSIKTSSIKFRIRATLNQQQTTQSPIKDCDDGESSKPRVLLNSLRVLEWDKVSDAVSSFAGTSLGRVAAKVVQFSLNSVGTFVEFIFQGFNWDFGVFLVGTIVVAWSDVWGELDVAKRDECGSWNSQAQWFVHGFYTHWCYTGLSLHFTLFTMSKCM